ncbi:MAG: ABC transporter substrate-binding protein, partial [Anaerolineae bacterium]
DPNGVVALKPKGITRPEDLVGKEILFLSPQAVWDLFLHINHIDPNDVTIVTPPDGGLSENIMPFITGQVDAIVGPVYEFAKPLTAFDLEHDTIVFYDYGLQIYPNVVFTTQQFIEERPDVVQHFVNAMLRGLHYAVEQPKATAEWFVEHYDEFLLPEMLAFQDETMAAIVPLIDIGTSEIGMMEADVWQQVHEGMVELGLLDISTAPGDAYTLEFLNAYYRVNP